MFNFSIPSATYLLCLVIKAGDSQLGLLESGPFPASEGFGWPSQRAWPCSMHQ